jgi:hypothetical protein
MVRIGIGEEMDQQNAGGEEFKQEVRSLSLCHTQGISTRNGCQAGSLTMKS